MQVSVLADFAVPYGTIVGGVGQLLLSLMNTPSSSSGTSPMTPGTVIQASEIGSELALCKAQGYKVSSDVP